MTVAPRPPIAAEVFRWVALVANGLLLLAGAANLFFGNCCMGVVALPLGIYNFIMLLGGGFDASQRIMALVFNILAIGAGLVGFPLALVLQRTVGQHLIDVPQEFHVVVVINSYAVAGALVLAGATSLVAAALRPTE